MLCCRCWLSPVGVKAGNAYWFQETEANERYLKVLFAYLVYFSQSPTHRCRLRSNPVNMKRCCHGCIWVAVFFLLGVPPPPPKGTRWCTSSDDMFCAAFALFKEASPLAFWIRTRLFASELLPRSHRIVARLISVLGSVSCLSQFWENLLGLLF